MWILWIVCAGLGYALNVSRVFEVQISISTLKLKKLKISSSRFLDASGSLPFRYFGISVHFRKLEMGNGNPWKIVLRTNSMLDGKNIILWRSSRSNKFDSYKFAGVYVVIFSN